MRAYSSMRATTVARDSVLRRSTAVAQAAMIRPVALHWRNPFSSATATDWAA